MSYSEKNKWRNDVCCSPGGSKGWKAVMKAFHISIPTTSLGNKRSFRATAVCAQPESCLSKELCFQGAEVGPQTFETASDITGDTRSTKNSLFLRIVLHITLKLQKFFTFL